MPTVCPLDAVDDEIRRSSTYGTHLFGSAAATPAGLGLTRRILTEVIFGVRAGNVRWNFFDPAPPFDGLTAVTVWSGGWVVG